MLYMAYGSNINKEQMEVICPGAKPVAIGFLKDYELNFRSSYSGSYLTVDEKLGTSVPVVIWEISSAHEKALDRHIGYPNFCRKQVKCVKSINDEALEAMIYIMNGGDIREPDKSYLDTCMKGYEDFNINKHYLWKAYLRSTEPKFN